jgi:hypothetical protein
MRAASVLAAPVLVTCLACTYSIPPLGQETDDAGDLTEASVNDASVPDGDAAGSDEGGGDAPSGTDSGAECTDGGILCSCTSASSCSMPTPICAQLADLGSDLGHADFCTQPCCTSANCPAGSVCFSGGAGGSYCVDPAWLSRSSTLGTAIGGASCSSGGQCRSGLCDGAGKCADTCCSFAASGAECASGSQCSFGTFPGAGSADKHFAAWCGPPGGAGQDGAQCSSSDQCAGGLCYTDTGGEYPPYCVQPCSTSAECGTSDVGCQLDAQGGDIYAACFPLTSQLAGQGASCSGTNGYEECLGGLCNAQGMCTNICFSDAVCTVSGWTCKPMLDDEYPPGSPTVLACGP